MKTDSAILRKIPSMIRISRSLFSLIHTISRFYPYLLLLTGLLHTLNLFVNILFLRTLTDSLVQQISGGPIIRLILIAAIIKLFIMALSDIANREANVQGLILNQEIRNVFAKKCMTINYASLETAKQLDLKESAAFAILSYGAFEQLCANALSLVTGFIAASTAFVVLARFNLIFLFSLTSLVIVGVALSRKHLIWSKKQQEKIIPINRRYAYFVNAALNPNNQKDYRVYGLSNLVHSKIEKYNKEVFSFLNRLNIEEANHLTIQAFLNGVIRFLAYAAASISAITPLLGNRLTIGETTFIVGATMVFAESLKSLIDSVFQISITIGYLEPFEEFMNLPETDSSGPALDSRPFEKLEFKSVRFSYPDSKETILNDISFSLKAGETMSIVGLNGSEKSTIVKLICRLFQPDEGTICWNGVPIETINLSAYWRNITCVFQDFQIFPFTIRENIASDDSSVAVSEIERAVKAVSLDQVIGKLEYGIDSLLGQDLYENGVELSFGEKQKIAIARAVCKKSDFFILDEPTASLDPVSELEIFERFKEITKGKTVIFISHRLSSAKFCDKILLLNQGKAEAIDAHAELMASSALYNRLFTEQASFYDRTPNAAQ